MNVPGASGVMRAFNQQPLYVVIEAKKVMDVIVISFLAFCNFFWILMAGCFTDWVYWYKGQNQAYMWMSGHMLEGMLSFDSLFVSHLIVLAYGRPSNLKQRPLYLRIIGAVVFRLAFTFRGNYLMHLFLFLQIVFGTFHA